MVDQVLQAADNLLRRAAETAAIGRRETMVRRGVDRQFADWHDGFLLGVAVGYTPTEALRVIRRSPARDLPDLDRMLGEFRGGLISPFGARYAAALRYARDRRAGDVWQREFGNRNDL